jgi:TRAP-type mannitol/chloroaromatic compound transport system substrate-binding protein
MPRSTGVTWLSTGAWDPCNFGTTKPIRSLEDLKGLRVYTFPTGGQFMSRFGVVPVTLPYEDVQPAIQTGELDGVCWCGITEMVTVGWADVLKYFLTNPISGAWAGSYFVNTEKWNEVPPHLQQLFKLAMDSSHYYRLHWYWAGEAKYRTTGPLELTSIPAAEWKTVEDEGAEVLGRGRRPDPAERQGRRDPEGLQRPDGKRPARPTAIRPPEAARPPRQRT